MNCSIYAGLLGVLAAAGPADQAFEKIAARYVEQFPALSPVAATALGDHRYDAQLDDVTAAARQRQLEFYRGFLSEVKEIDRAQLSRANQVDHSLLTHHLRARIWRLTELREWSWNPLVYTEMCGGAVYNLMARNFAPERERLERVADRLEQFPRLYRQIRKTLIPRDVPKIHAETAIKQNRGVIAILDNMVEPRLGELPPAQRQQMQAAIQTAKAAVEEHQKWLESQLLPNAGGDFRLGKERYDKKLAFTLQSALSRAQQVLSKISRQFGIGDDTIRTRLTAKRREQSSRGRSYYADQQQPAIVETQPKGEFTKSFRLGKRAAGVVASSPAGLAPVGGGAFRGGDSQCILPTNVHTRVGVERSRRRAVVQTLSAVTDDNDEKNLLVECDELGQEKSESDTEQRVKDLLALIAKQKTGCLAKLPGCRAQAKINSIPNTNRRYSPNCLTRSSKNTNRHAKRCLDS